MHGNSMRQGHRGSRGTCRPSSHAACLHAAMLIHPHLPLSCLQRFNTDPRTFCFILSTRSGGVGINLTGADTVRGGAGVGPAECNIAWALEGSLMRGPLILEMGRTCFLQPSALAQTTMMLFPPLELLYADRLATVGLAMLIAHLLPSIAGHLL